jgi:hypothetical protein
MTAGGSTIVAETVVTVEIAVAVQSVVAGTLTFPATC